MTQNRTFARLLRMAVNGIAAYEGKNATLIEEELGAQIGLSAAAIQRYKAGHVPPEPRTVQILAEAAVHRGRLDRTWLNEFLTAAAHPMPTSVHEQLFPAPLLPHASRPKQPVDHNRSRMIDQVQHVWINGLLEQSLYYAVLVDLDMLTQPGAIEHPWDVIVQQPDQPARALPVGATIATTFDELNGALLILGAPGAGKTTMLLELARELLERARHDPNHAIPVVVNLSSWSSERTSLADWLVDELHLRYQAPRRIVQRWMANHQLLPLFDGLDEVRADQRAACVAALNTFRRDHGLAGMVVASRSNDYATLTQRLQLNGAVALQPLRPEQIERYLAAAGPQLAELRTALQHDGALRELAASPLMLSIMSLACRGDVRAAFAGTDSIDERRQQIFTLYVERMFMRRSAAAPYTPAQVRRWLGWLAVQMQQRSLSVFAIERMQPAWLPNLRAQVAFSILAGALMSLVTCLLILAGLIMTMLFLPLHPETPAINWGALAVAGPVWLFTLPLALAIGAIIGFGSSLIRLMRGHIDQSPTIRLVETLHWSPRKALPWLMEGMLAGQIMGLLVGMQLHYIGEWSYGLLAVLVCALSGGGVVGVLAALIGGLSTGEVEQRTTPNQGMKQSARYALRAILAGPLVALAVGPLLAGAAFLTGMITYPDSFFSNQSPLWNLAAPLVVLLFIAAPLLGLLIALVSGGTACLHHGVLRLLLWRSGAIPWNMAQFLDYATERLFLRRVGGSYMFVHRLLLEHIAATDGAAWQAQVQPYSTGSVTINLKRERKGERFQPAGLQRTRFTGRLFDHIAERLPQRRRLIGRLSAVSTLILLTMALSIGLVLYTPDQRLERTLTGTQPIRALELAGTEIVAVGSGTRNVQRWTPEGTVQTVAVSAPDYGIAYALSPNGAIYAVGTAGRTTELRRSSDGALLHTLPGYNAHFAPDNERVLTEINPNQIKIWSITDGAELGSLTPPRPIHSPMAFSANGDTVALVDGTNVVQFWNLTPPHTPIGQIVLPTGIIPAPGSPAMAYGWMSVNVTALAFAPDDSFVAAALSDGTIRLHRLGDPDRQPTELILAGHSSFIQDLAFAPDGQTLASASSDRTVRLWRVTDGVSLATLRGHFGGVASVRFTPDGKNLVSGSADHTIRLWRIMNEPTP